MWKRIKVRNSTGWVSRDAIVVGIWAAHEMLGVPLDRSATWSVTHVPTGMFLELGPITAQEAAAVAAHLGRRIRIRTIDRLLAERWMLRSLAAEALASERERAAVARHRGQRE
jgi:hypothetical protein